MGYFSNENHLPNSFFFIYCFGKPGRHQGGTREAGKDQLDSLRGTREAGKDSSESLRGTREAGKDHLDSLRGTREAGKSHLDSLGGTREAGKDHLRGTREARKNNLDSLGPFKGFLVVQDCLQKPSRAGLPVRLSRSTGLPIESRSWKGAGFCITFNTISMAIGPVRGKSWGGLHGWLPVA